MVLADFHNSILTSISAAKNELLMFIYYDPGKTNLKKQGIVCVVSRHECSWGISNCSASMLPVLAAFLNSGHELFVPRKYRLTIRGHSSIT